MIEYPKYKKVLFCTDFSDNANHAFNFAYGVAKRDEGLLYVLHVTPDIPHKAYIENYITAEDSENIRKAIEEDLNDKYTRLYVNEIKDGVNYKLVSLSGREDEEIIKFAKKEKVDIIVIGTHGRTGIEHVFFGSVAEKVIRYSPYPVFVIPCKRKPQ